MRATFFHSTDAVVSSVHALALTVAIHGAVTVTAGEASERWVTLRNFPGAHVEISAPGEPVRYVDSVTTASAMARGILARA